MILCYLYRTGNIFDNMVSRNGCSVFTKCLSTVGNCLVIYEPLNEVPMIIGPNDTIMFSKLKLERYSLEIINVLPNLVSVVKAYNLSTCKLILYCTTATDI